MKSYISLLLLFMFSLADAQILDQHTEKKVSLKDGVQVSVYATVHEPSRYYYTPRHIQLSVEKGVPEVSLILFKENDKEVTGGILHVLFRWGLTSSQEKELQQYISAHIDSAGTLAGAADLRFINNEIEFETRHTLSAQLKKAANVPVRIPAEPIHKTAVSFQLNATLAKAINDNLNSPGKLDAVILRAQFQFSVAEESMIATLARNERSEMTTSLGAWIRQISRYKQLKYVFL